MLNDDKKGASLLLKYNNLSQEHTIWISQEIKKKKFMMTRGREVLIDIPGSYLKHIVNIPSKNEAGYIDAWIEVYNLALDYLEGSLKLACEENKYIKQVGSAWILNGHNVAWPRENPENVEYAKGLERILDEYNYVKEKSKEHFSESKGIVFNKTSVKLIPANEVVMKSFRIKETETDQSSEITDNESKPNLIINKISDGDILNNMDISDLREKNTDIVVLTCQNIELPKEEDIFLTNIGKCRYEGFNTGAFIYGHSEEQRTGDMELKRILRLLEKCGSNFSNLIIYSVNNDYIAKNKDSDIKLLDFINFYNVIAKELTNHGYIPLICMNIFSKKIIDDLNHRYSINNECEVIYMDVVRDLQNIGSDVSTIIVDPINDYDIVNICSKNVLQNINRVISNTSSDKTLYKK